jgi:hypothetical protein
MSNSITSASVSVNVNSAPPAAVDGPSTRRTADGGVQFENENYRITAGDNNEVTIYNKNTGESYRVWGDPHVDVDGQHAFDFWGQTTFVLDDGTRVTFATTPWEGGNNGATVTSEITIVDGGGDYVSHIEGIDTNTQGDLSFAEVTVDGAALDVDVREGNTIFENENGSGFFVVDESGNIKNVDQAFINATDEVKQQGQDLLQHYAAHFNGFSGFASISIFGDFASSSGNDAGQNIRLVGNPGWQLPWSRGGHDSNNGSVQGQPSLALNVTLLAAA